MPYFTFTQAAIGDMLRVTPTLAHYTIIEAHNAHHANLIAVELGMDFRLDYEDDGVERTYKEDHANYIREFVPRYHKVDMYDGFDVPAVHGEDILLAFTDPEQPIEYPHDIAVIHKLNPAIAPIWLQRGRVSDATV